MLTEEEEMALENYVKFMAAQGFPLSRDMMRCFIKEIVVRSGRPTLFNMQKGPRDKGPSDNCFLKFFGRHPELTEKKPETQDRSRISNKKIIDDILDFFEETVKKNGLTDKPAQIFNCDETGWSGKECSRQKVFGLKSYHTYQQRVITADHVTAHLCISVDGPFLPTMLIYKGSLPHREYQDRGSQYMVLLHQCF